MAEKEPDKENTTESGSSLTDQEQLLAQSALSDYTKQNYASSSSSLQKLETTLAHDYKVTHNKAVVEYYLSGLKHTDAFQKKLQAIRPVSIYSGDECIHVDDAEHCALYYNHAVLLFHLRKYNLALSITKQMFTYIEPMEESLAHKVCLLLLELLLFLRRVDEALKNIGYIITQFASTRNIQVLEEPTEKKPVIFDAATDAFRQKLLQYQTRCYLLCGNLNGALRELKAIEATKGAEGLSTLFLASNLEYLRGQYDKAFELLNRAQKAKCVSFEECGISVPLMYFNNMGCLHHQMGKFQLAAFYFHRALRENEELEKKFSNFDPNEPLSNRPIYTFGGNRYAQLMYNVGVSQLFAGQPTQAFDCLLQAVQVFHLNPRLWLRMAECCIMTHKKENEDEFALPGRRKNFVQGVLGEGVHRKILLSSLVSRNGFGGVGEQSYAIPAPTLEFASLCLKNALILLPPMIEGERRDKNISSAVTPAPMTKKSKLNSMYGAPSNLMSDSEVQSLRVSTLTSSAYVSLCLGDYIPALGLAEELLREPRLPGAHRTLAHLYAAEALVQLDRIAEAIEHLNPDHVIDLDVSLPIPGLEGVHSTSPKHDWYPNKPLTGKIAMQYNMAVAFAMRGELDKAGELLKYIWSLKAKADIPLEIVMLLLYIELQLGHAENARFILKQNCSLIR